MLALYREFFRAHGALVSLMSGSGSTTFRHLRQSSKSQTAVVVRQSSVQPVWILTWIR